MKNNHKYLILLALAGTVLATSCSDDDPKNPSNPNEQEVITTVVLKAVRQGTTDTLEFINRPQNNVPNQPVRIDTVRLQANGVYTLLTEFLDETKNPVKDITEEVEEEAAQHQVFYASTPGSLFTIDPANLQPRDAESRPVGTRVNLVATGSAGAGSLKITLLHDLNKAGTNVAQNDPTNAGGDTDVEVTFPVVLQ